MNLTLNETTTIVAALKYLKANRDEAREAMSDEDDVTGEVTSPLLLTEDEIEALCGRIDDGVLSLSPLSLMTVYVASVAGKPKGILTAKEYESTAIAWWDSIQPKEVPIEDFNAGKITLATINQY